jgi:hypothetical protein
VEDEGGAPSVDAAEGLHVNRRDVLTVMCERLSERVRERERVGRDFAHQKRVERVLIGVGETLGPVGIPAVAEPALELTVPADDHAHLPPASEKRGPGEGRECDEAGVHVELPARRRGKGE